MCVTVQTKRDGQKWILRVTIHSGADKEHEESFFMDDYYGTITLEQVLVTLELQYIDDDEERLAQDTYIVLYRCLMESLSNR